MVEIEKHEGLIIDVIRQLFGGMAKAHKIAKERGMDIDDLMQLGYLGMLKASKKYDATKSEWSTYAFTFIKGEILNNLNRSFLVKLPTKMSIKEKKEAGRVTSLYENVKDEEKNMFLVDVLPSDKEHFAEEFATHEEFKFKVNKVLSKLEKEAICERVYNDLTHEEIAERLGCTRRYVGTLIKNAIGKLSEELLVS